MPVPLALLSASFRLQFLFDLISLPRILARKCTCLGYYRTSDRVVHRENTFVCICLSIRHIHIHTHTHTYTLRLLFRLRATLAKNTECIVFKIARSSYIAYILRRTASNLSLFIIHREHGEPEIRGHRQF